MKRTEDIWQYTSAQDCSWYWKKQNSLKGGMFDWYQGEQYRLTSSGIYLVSSRYGSTGDSHKT